jgi:YXWGXW repeat-containing protein
MSEIRDARRSPRSRNQTADFLSQSVATMKCDATVRSLMSLAMLSILATIASAQPIDLLAPPLVTPPPNNAAPAQPTVTYALLPGHWQLRGAQYFWVPPETIPRPVTYWRFVEGYYVWRGGEWVWVPGHYE